MLAMGQLLSYTQLGTALSSTDSPQASQDLLVQPRASVPASPVIPTAHTNLSSAEPGTLTTQPAEPGDPGQMDQPLRRSQQSEKRPEYLADFELG